MKSLYVFVVSLSILVNFCLAQLSPPQFDAVTVSGRCTSKEKCTDCLRSDPKCAWCKTPNVKFHRCDNVAFLERNGCEAGDIEYPVSILNVTKDGNADFSDHSSDPASPLEAIQLKPQAINMELRLNEEKTYEFEFKMATNYPVDLYYLTDLSASMKDDIKAVATVGKDIAKIFKAGSLTTNVKMGFGVFSDKIMSPFIIDTEKLRQNPCGLSDDDAACDAAFNYKHKLTLSDDIEGWIQTVNITSYTGNIDKPESGLSAVIQAVVCKDKIGWRENSRKIILYSSDGNFHVAGDGRLAGLLKPDTLKCRLNADNQLQNDLYDYPSVGQLRSTLLKEKANIIFAVNKTELPIFERLSSMLEGSGVGELTRNSANIIKLISDNYRQISQEVIMVLPKQEGLELSLDSDCNDGEGWTVGRANCSSVSVGKTVKFRVRVKATECSDATRRVNIGMVGLPDKLALNIRTRCGCMCEAEDKPLSSECENKGSKKCGICYCQEKHYGPRCNCDTDRPDEDPHKNCRAYEGGPKCTNRGRCDCGKCVCEVAVYWGPFCECDRTLCPKHLGKRCSDNGECTCDGTCKCDSGWTGADCSCADTQETCKYPGQDKLCSGNGECSCGQCQCNAGYFGDYCEDCPECNEGCDMNQECVECKVHVKGAKLSAEECDVKCAGKDITLKSELKDTKCLYKDSEGCSYSFTYIQVGPEPKTDMIITALDRKDCPNEIDIMYIVIAVFVTVILIGLVIIIIYKIHLYCQTKKEMATYEAEQGKERSLIENTIYQAPTTSHPNLMYSEN